MFTNSLKSIFEFTARQKKSILLFLLSFLIVALGQPAASPFLGLIASAFGFALFWVSILAIESGKQRFLIGSFWFFLVQNVQLFWLLSHPYLYIYALYLFLSISMGIQFGLLTLLVTPKLLRSFLKILGASGFWVLMEWSRLFLLSGFSFNPVGLSLTSSLYGLQGASLFGVYGLSFWVILVNLLALAAFEHPKGKKIFSFLICAALPYLYGYFHFDYHSSRFEGSQNFNALLVQTAFPIEENLRFDSLDEAVSYVEGEWIKILQILKERPRSTYDMIVLPEYIVPFGTYKPLYRLDNVRKIFTEHFGASSHTVFADLGEPFVFRGDSELYAANALWLQALSNWFNADLVVGLQDDEWISESERQSFSSAFYFKPHGKTPLRYEKRVLLPMGEYIPFSFCREIAKKYGISGSFTCGKEAKVFSGSKLPFGLSICYEETYGDLMRESRKKGAEMLVNLTSDVWFPGSSLPIQHLSHARLRTVEGGIPLLRACNTGVTAAFDSLGRVAGMLGDGSNRFEWVREALSVNVPTYHYNTLYSKFGDRLIVGFSIFSLFFLIRRKP